MESDQELRVKAIDAALSAERGGSSISAEALVVAAKTIYDFLAAKPTET